MCETPEVCNVCPLGATPVPRVLACHKLGKYTFYTFFKAKYLDIFLYKSNTWFNGIQITHFKRLTFAKSGQTGKILTESWNEKVSLQIHQYDFKRRQSLKLEITATLTI